MFTEMQRTPPPDHPFYLRTGPIDPVLFAGPGFSLNIRMLRSTEDTLQALCASEGLTFWGHAAGIIFDYFAAHPTQADIQNLTPENAPPMLLKNGGSRRWAPMTTSRQIRAILTPPALQWVAGQTATPKATEPNQEVARLCALILHRNVATGATLVQVARQAFKTES